MKQILTLALTVILTGSIAGCQLDEPTYGQLGIVPTYSGGIRMYADQVFDTTYRVSSTSDWTLTSQPSWLSISPQSGAVEAGTIAFHKLTLTPSLNTTGTTRTGTINVSSKDGYGVAMPIIQYGFLNVTRPAVSYNSDSNSFLFRQLLTDAARTDSVSVKLYSETATITSDRSWVTVQADSTYPTGLNQMYYTVSANTSDTTRTANLTLTTASGIKTVINLIQYAKQQ